MDELWGMMYNYIHPPSLHSTLLPVLLGGEAKVKRRFIKACHRLSGCGIKGPCVNDLLSV